VLRVEFRDRLLGFRYNPCDLTREAELVTYESFGDEGAVLASPAISRWRVESWVVVPCLGNGSASHASFLQQSLGKGYKLSFTNVSTKARISEVNGAT
jgi:hypothetical protein